MFFRAGWSIGSAGIVIAVLANGADAGDWKIYNPTKDSRYAPTSNIAASGVAATAGAAMSVSLMRDGKVVDKRTITADPTNARWSADFRPPPGGRPASPNWTLVVRHMDKDVATVKFQVVPR